MSSLIPGKFYWALPVLDPDADAEWINQPQPARYCGNDQWEWIGYEGNEWPARWVGSAIEQSSEV